MVDFDKYLVNWVNNIEYIPLKCSLEANTDEEYFIAIPRKGGTTSTEYYDGTKEKKIRYEFRVKSKNLTTINNILFLLEENIEDIVVGEIKNNDIILQRIDIINEPYIDELASNDWFIKSLDVQVNLTVFK
ncbi:hypothetical protein [Floricoccus penangensis]|uniref:hypothetical protein n=1 Tax=Floricoccus penangensis TaxID=1859475 RepID=UPI00203A6F83|nr:hypothetical protein [Floricoccus penangensis]URZ87552.1 hypothetical protein KIW23_00440 [Floricoccus penangensis]